MARLARLALFPILLALGACAADPLRAEERLAQPLVARDLEFTRTSALHFGEAAAPAGYLVEFLRVPAGMVDERAYRAGSALVQDVQLADLGFVSPGGAGYRFTPDGQAAPLGYASRNDHVQALLGGRGRVHLLPLDPQAP